MGKPRTYVIYTGVGREQAVRDLVVRLVDPALVVEAFVPRYEKKVRRAGTWRTELAAWVPGYLFVETPDAYELRRALGAVPGITRVLAMGAELVPLGEREVEWLGRLTKPKERTVKLSVAYQVGDRIVVTEGPLAGFESEIVKVDRHKRVAYINFGIPGREKLATVGLEVVAKLGASGQAADAGGAGDVPAWADGKREVARDAEDAAAESAEQAANEQQ